MRLLDETTKNMEEGIEIRDNDLESISGGTNEKQQFYVCQICGAEFYAVPSIINGEAKCENCR